MPSTTSIPSTSQQTSLIDSAPSNANANAFSQIVTGQSQMQADNNAKSHKRKQLSIATYIPKKMTVDMKKDIDQSLLNLFTKDYQPFKLVEDKGFKQFVKMLNPNYTLPNRHSISKQYIPALYEKRLREVKELVVQEAKHVCLTTDCWTSRNNESFMAITIHFVDSNFSLQSILISCSSFNENHTAINLSEQIQKTIDEWQLEGKIELAVSDNATNIKNALGSLQLKHLGCFAHTLNLVVQSALTLENELIDKVKTIVTYFRRSTVANNKLKSYQINNGIDKPKKLLQDVQTRWNSTYYMLNRFIELENPIRGTLGLLDKAPQTLNSDEWSIIKELCTVLRPFEEATRAVSGESYMTASIVIVLTQGLLNACKKLHTMEFNERTLMIIKQLLDNMEKRDAWKNVDKSKTLCRCTFLDPRFKNIPFNNNNSLSETTKNEIIEKTANIIYLERSNQLDEQNQDQPDYISIDTPSTSNSPSIWETIDTSIAKLIPSGTSKSRAIIEVQRYLEEGMLKRNMDPIKWWQEHKYNYPYLHILAKQTLCCLGTSVPCERIFSKAGLILNDRRCRLKSEKVEMLLFLNYNST